MLATFVLFYCNNYTAMYMQICISCLHIAILYSGLFLTGKHFTNKPILTFQRENFCESSRALSDLILLVHIFRVKFLRMATD